MLSVRLCLLGFTKSSSNTLSTGPSKYDVNYWVSINRDVVNLEYLAIPTGEMITVKYHIDKALEGIVRFIDERRA